MFRKIRFQNYNFELFIMSKYFLTRAVLEFATKFHVKSIPNRASPKKVPCKILNPYIPKLLILWPNLVSSLSCNGLKLTRVVLKLARFFPVEIIANQLSVFENTQNQNFRSLISLGHILQAC
jgi:hypothetical protein